MKSTTPLPPDRTRLLAGDVVRVQGDGVGVVHRISNAGIWLFRVQLPLEVQPLPTAAATTELLPVMPPIRRN